MVYESSSIPAKGSVINMFWCNTKLRILRDIPFRSTEEGNVKSRCFLCAVSDHGVLSVLKHLLIAVGNNIRNKLNTCT